MCGNLVMRSVVIPDSVTYIGKDAFCAQDISSVTIPNTVKWIDDGAFFCDGCVGYYSGMDEATYADREKPYQIKDVYFIGEKEEWDAIKMGHFNQALTLATIHFVKQIPMMDNLQSEEDEPTEKSVPVVAPELSELLPTPETAQIPETAQTPETSKTLQMPAVTDKAVPLSAAAESGALSQLWQMEEDVLPALLAEEFEIPANAVEVSEISEMPAASDTAIDGYVPSVSVNALCMNLGLSGIALSLAAAVVRRRRRRFLAGGLIPKAA